MHYMVHVLAASYDYSIGDEGVNALAIWVLVVNPWGSIIHWPRYECSFFSLALICQISSIYPYPELFGKSDEKCIPDDQLPHHKTWTCIITIDKRSTFHKAIGWM